MALINATEERGGAHGRLAIGETLALITVVIAILGMFFSSPRFAGPDENAHQATAWYIGSNGLPPRAETPSSVPAIIPSMPCFAFSPEADTGCVGPRVAEGASEVRVLNYPPVYYWVVAAGQRIVDGVSSAWLDMGGRGASALLNIAALVLLALLLRRDTTHWGTYVLLVTTPMAAFLWAVVNPSGWEITTALIFAYLFGTAWWRGSDPTTGALRPATLIGLGVASLLFGLSRHDAFVWMSLLIVGAALMGDLHAPLRDRARLLLVSALGIGASVVWNLVYKAEHVLWNEFPVADPGFSDYVGWLGQIDNAMSDRIRQMLGVLGWLDTPIPQWLMFALLAGWALLLGAMFARGRLPAYVVVFGFAVSIFLPMVIEVIRWNDWPYWYQGRITLPFTLGFLLLILIRYGRSVGRPAQAMSIVMSLALAFMVWQNLMRNAFGIRGYLPQRWSAPTLDTPMYVAAWLCIAAIIILAVARIWLLRTPGGSPHGASKIDAA